MGNIKKKKKRKRKEDARLVENREAVRMAYYEMMLHESHFEENIHPPDTITWSQSTRDRNK